MKSIQLGFVLLFLITLNQTWAQDRFLTREGYIRFYSSAPLEDIEAHNYNVLSIVDLNQGQVAVDMLIKNFHFENKLMQEHFNENYMESAKYPKASFKGSFDVPAALKNLEDGDYNLQVSGDITIHGVTKPLETNVTLVVKEGSISTTFSFIVKVKDHEIKIPGVVVKNIAEEVEVTASFEYEPYKR
ncbi:YceI family protein [Roseivirga sp.]|uniref:YceI family protein n=1 Tax=Roseivirga sp. TaxID=1964215 RepID=UPI003B51B546